MAMDSQTGDKKLLVVLGATGNQGNAVLRYFASSLSKQRYKLRGVTRSIASDASKRLVELGVEMVEGDLDNLLSLQSAFSGATHIFANTDSSQLIFNAIKQPDLLAERQTPTSYAHDIELTRGRHIAEAAASIETLHRLVWSSISSPKKWSGGRYTTVSMWDVKEEISEILKSKAELQDKVSVLIVGIYATMPLKVPQMYAPQKVSTTLLSRDKEWLILARL